MCPSGTGYKNTARKNDIKEKKGLMSMSLMRLLSKKLAQRQSGSVVTVEPIIRQILAISITKERNMFVAERFVSGLIKIHGKHPAVSTDDGGTWYPQACRFLKVDRLLHSSYWKSIIERLYNT